MFPTRGTSCVVLLRSYLENVWIAHKHCSVLRSHDDAHTCCYSHRKALHKHKAHKDRFFDSSHNQQMDSIKDAVVHATEY